MNAAELKALQTPLIILVIVIGLKLVVDWAFNSKEHPHRINFHDFSHVEFWAFWIAMIVCFCVGFIPKKKPHDGPPALTPSGA